MIRGEALRRAGQAVNEAVDANEISPVKRPRGMTAITVTLPAGVPQRFNVSGDYFHVLSAPGGDLVAKFDDAKTMPAYQALGVRVYYDVIELSSASGQTVTVLVGFGSVFDGRTSTDSPPNQLPATPKVSCANGARTLLAAADASRVSLRITLESTAAGSVWYGGSTVGVGAEGALLEPGVTDFIDTTAAIYVWNPNGADVDVYVQPLRRA